MDKHNLKSVFTEHWAYLALSTACELDLFDYIKNGTSKIRDLNKVLKTNGKGLLHLIEFLIDKNYLIQNNNELELSSKSEVLTENHPESLKYACILWSQWHLDAFKNLKKSILSGTSYFEKYEHSSYFEMIKNDKKEFKIYHRAMDEYARDDYRNIASKLDLNAYNSFIDIGGGSGKLLSYLQQAEPLKSYFLFESPEVLELFNDQSVNKCSGDFFKEIPKVAEVAILSRVIHDWNDELASTILKNVFNSLPTKGRLIVIENCQDLTKTKHHLLSLNMLVMCNSHERTSTNYINLIESNGFNYDSISQLNDLQFILQFSKK
ncbi:MAG: hypothetical protein IT222_05135 [Crocinitomix sp.]|nr:hypothetical protein [Crocinitomix sp.]